MTKNEPFKFKEFTIHQEKCAMKVGTDGVLLGAWVEVDEITDSILDIGTGSGLIALQLAQRSNAEQIDAIEIEDLAYEQAVENFESSIWNDRLFCYHCSLVEYADDLEEKYDLIVSNPPFYEDQYESTDKARNKARFTSSLSFKSLLENVKNLMNESGRFALIIPFKEQENFVQLASVNGLFLNRFCTVKGRMESPIKRILMEFGFHKSEIKEEELAIELARHEYTPAYIELVKDFYLKM